MTAIDLLVDSAALVRVREAFAAAGGGTGAGRGA